MNIEINKMSNNNVIMYPLIKIVKQVNKLYYAGKPIPKELIKQFQDFKQSLYEIEDKIVLSGVLNSCEAMVTNRDFISFSSFSRSKA